MAISTVNVPCPTTNGSGIPATVDAFALNKAVIVSGDFSGQATITVEASGASSGDDWLSVVVTQKKGVFTIATVAQRLRVTVTGHNGVTMVPVVDIAAEAGTPTFVELVATAGNGVGAAVDVSAVPEGRSLFVTGTFSGVVEIEGSNDGVNWTQVFSTVTNTGVPLQVDQPVVWLRVRRTGVLSIIPGQPVVWVGGVLPAGSGGGGVTFPLDAGAGALGAPEIYYGIANTGLYAPAASQLAVSAGAVEASLWTVQGIGILAGTVLAPGAFIQGDTNTGLYSPGADQLAVSVGGSQVTAFASTGVTFNAAVRATPSALTYGTNIPVDGNLANAYTVTLSGVTAQLNNPTNLAAGQSFTVIVTQDGIGGRALTFGTNYDFGNEGAPDLTTSGMGIVDIISCYVISPTKVACTTLRGF